MTAEAMRAALEALESIKTQNMVPLIHQAKEGLRAALAQRADEPVAPTCPRCNTLDVSFERTCHNSACADYAKALTVFEGWKHLAPAAPAYVPLTDEEMLKLARTNLDQGLSWAPHIVRCTDLEVKTLMRAIESLVVARMRGENT